MLALEGNRSDAIGYTRVIKIFFSSAYKILNFVPNFETTLLGAGFSQYAPKEPNYFDSSETIRNMQGCL
jgi:hypothetical protein